MNKELVKVTVSFSVLALFILTANTDESHTWNHNKNATKDLLSETKNLTSEEKGLTQDLESLKPREIATLSSDSTFISSTNFKLYHNIMEKVVRSPEDKAKYRNSLKDVETLEATSKYLISPQKEITKDERINHLKASAFLIEALTFHPQNPSVLKSVLSVLNVNLSEAKSSLSKQAYKILEENKAEVMYHALAVSSELQNSYTPDEVDVESNRIYTNVNNLHKENKEVSYKMIAENR